MSRLVRARDVPRLVLHPDASDVRESERGAELGAACERSLGEPVPVECRDLRVELSHERAERLVRETAAHRDVVGVEQRAVANEGVRLGGHQRETNGREVELASKDVVDIVASDPRSGTETDTAPTGSGTAPQPAQTSATARRAHRASRTPVRALKSSIRSSQAGTSSRRRGPEAWIPPRLELLERDALLLDPGEVAEVEDPLALDASQLQEVVGRRSEQVLAEDLCGSRSRRIRRRSTGRARSRARCRTSQRRQWRP